MMLVIFFSEAKLGIAGRGSLLRSGVKRFTVAQAVRHKAAASRMGAGLEKRDMVGKMKRRMMNALRGNDKINVSKPSQLLTSRLVNND